MRISLVVVDDHQLFRQALIHCLVNIPDVAVVGQAASGEELLSLVKQAPPHVVLLDIDLPGLSGLACAQQLAVTHPQLPIIFLTMHDVAAFRQAREELPNVKDYLIKNTNLDNVLQSVRTVAQAAYPGLQFRGVLTSADAASGLPTHDLTRQEVAVLRLMLEQFTNDEIATRLFKSVRTIEEHRSNIYQKTGARTLVGVVQYALRHNLITVEEFKSLNTVQC